MCRVKNMVAAQIVCALLLASAVAGAVPKPPPKAPLPYVRTSPGVGRLSIDPQQSFVAENALMSNLPMNFNGMVINNFVGADRFYKAGITGQNAVIANIEAGHIWSGHETLGHVGSFTTGTGALGETDRHATWVAMMLGGRRNPSVPRDFQTGIAIDADLRSGAVATSWNPSPTGPNPRYSLSFNVTGDSYFSTYAPAFGTSDVINSSFGFIDATGSNARTVGVDGLARTNPRTTFVVAAGNRGAGANSVTGAGSGYNSIAVANLTNANSYDIVNSGSSRGPQDYSDPVRGLVPGARVAVDIAAPGTNLTSAYYGGETGGNSPVLGGPPSGSAGGPNFYSFSVAGTSFAAPIVAGGAALLDSASYNTPAMASNADSRDSRVIKSVLLNSATKIPGWNNGQAPVAGVVATAQALDYAVGAGRLNLRDAYDQYLGGTTDLPGTAGGAVEPLGWDFGEVSPSGVSDYVIDGVLEADTPFSATLSWFRDRAFIDHATVSDDAYRDLDLEVWDSTFTTLVAQSQSRYENVEHLSFLVPETGEYGLRVRYFQTLFGAPAPESYGLAWANAALPAWASANAGNWSAGGNWSTAAAPNAVGAVARLGPAITAPRTVTLDVPVTLEALKFDSDHAYTIGGAQSLTLDGTSGRAGIEVISGSHVISVPLTLLDTTHVIVPDDRTLSVSGQIEATGVDVNKSGGGTLVVNHLRLGALSVNAGAVRANADGGTSKVAALTVAVGAKLDLTNNKMIVAGGDVGAADGSTYFGLSGLIQSGHGGGTWNGSGIVTGMPDAAGGLTSLGIATAEQTGYAGGSFGGLSVTAGDVLIMYTYRGDANLDGFISGDDYSAIDFASGTPGASGWVNGDFTWDGIISGDDYSAIDFNLVAQGAPFPTGTSASAVVAVPEPVSVLPALAAIMRLRRRRKS